MLQSQKKLGDNNFVLNIVQNFKVYNIDQGPYKENHIEIKFTKRC